MKKFIAAAILVGALVMLVGGTALAAGPTTPFWQGLVPSTSTETGTPPCGSLGVGAMPRGGAPEWAGNDDAVAELLGMTAEEIQAARLDGQSLAEMAAAKNVSEDALIDAMVSAREDAVAELVAEGKLTQVRADLMIENMREMTKTMVERSGVGPAFGDSTASGMMGQGMRGGRWNR